MSYEDDPTNVQELEAQRLSGEALSVRALALEVDDLKWLMSDKRGRRVVARLLERAGVWRSSFNSDALQMAFNEGVRNEGLRLLDMVTAHCRERYVEMLKES